MSAFFFISNVISELYRWGLYFSYLKICKRKACGTLRHFCITDSNLCFFIQKTRIFDAETSILTLFRFNLWTIDHKKTLGAQGFVVVLLLRHFFQKKIDFSESCFFCRKKAFFRKKMAYYFRKKKLD